MPLTFEKLVLDRRSIRLRNPLAAFAFDEQDALAPLGEGERQRAGDGRLPRPALS